MKKKLSLFMALMLTVSMMPFSAFAAEDDENVYVPDGAPKVAQTYANEQIMVVIDLGDYTSLREGYVDLTIKNARLANIKNPISYKLTQNDKEITSGTTIKFEDRRQDALIGGESDFVMRVTGNDLENKAKNNIKIFLMMNLDFTESKLGDVDLEIKDRSQNGVGNHTETIAYQMGDMQRDMQVDISDSKTRIGQDGGTLSAFMIKSMDRLDSVKSNNDIVVKLPDKLKFDKATTVKLDGNILTPSYNDKMTTMTINEVSSINKSVTVVPVVRIEGKDIPYGEVEVNIEFRVKNRIVDGKTAKIGSITDNSVEMLIKEKGKTNIPEMGSAESKTVEVTLTGLKDSFKKDTYLYFDVDGIDLSYNGITITEPKGKLILLGESAGKLEDRLVNSKEVYKDGKFSMKVLDSSMEKIQFTMEITAKPSLEGRATIELSANQFNTTKTELARINSRFSVESKLSLGKKGVAFKANDIKIRESKAGMFNTGDKLYFSLDNSQVGFDVADISISATSGLEFSTPRKGTDGIIELEVLRKSYNGPGTAVISGVKVFSLETAVSGTSNLEIKLNKDVIFDSEYVQIVGEISSSTVFTIGNKSYNSSGVQKEAVEAPYIKNGYTMLPVKALAQALGLSSSWDNANKVATFANDKKVAVVKLGSGEMIVNGTPIKLAVPAEIKNGATMIELRSLASGFGVSIAWNGAQKTATVTSN